MEDDWADLLDPGEEILWQGRPNGGYIVINFEDLPWVMPAGLFIAEGLLTITGTGKGIPPVALHGLFFLLTGIGILTVLLFGKAWLRRRTQYILTNFRAITVTDLPLWGRRLESFPIRPDTIIDHRQKLRQTVFFAKRLKRGVFGTHEVPLGFEQLHDGPQVMKLIRQIQQDAA